MYNWLFIFKVNFVLKITDDLCLFALSCNEIKHHTRHCQVENSFNFTDKMYKEKVIKRKIVNFKMRKNEQSSRRKYIENYNKKILMRIQFISEVLVYRQKL